jgi:hypothetical protein
MEVFLDGRWWVFDPRNNSRRMGRILIARGRDAADVPLTQTFGPSTLTQFDVWTRDARHDPAETHLCLGIEPVASYRRTEMFVRRRLARPAALPVFPSWHPKSPS